MRTMSNRATRKSRIGAFVVLAIGLLTTAEALAQAGTSAKTTYVYKTVNELEILADVYEAAGDEARPTILLLHGGALIFGTRNADARLVGAYVSRGYNVVAIDYRLAPETKLPEIIEDVADAYQWIRTRGPDLFGADPSRIAVIGHSAGAYLAQVAGYKFRPRPRAIVSFYGYGDVTGPWYTQPSEFYSRQFPAISQSLAFRAVGEREISNGPITGLAEGRGAVYLYARQQGVWPSLVADHDPVAERQWFASFEPVRNLSPEYPPTMLLHGEADTDVPYEKSVRMADELKGLGVPCEFVTNPEWGHLFDQGQWDASVTEAVSRVLDFLDKHLGGSRKR